MNYHGHLSRDFCVDKMKNELNIRDENNLLLPAPKHKEHYCHTQK